MKKLLVISHCFVVPGYRKVLRYLSVAPDLSVTAIVPDWWPEGGRRVHARKGGEDNYNLLIRRPWSHRQHLHVYPTLPSLLRREKPDFIFLLEEPNSLVTASTLLLAKRLCPSAKTAFYTFLNDDREFEKMPGVRRRLFPWALDVSFRLADVAICASQAAREQMRRRGFQGRAAVIPFGADVRGLMEVDRGKAVNLRERLAGPGDFVFGFAGRLSVEKGVDLILKAFSHLPSRQSARLVIIGDGPERQNLERQAKALGLAGHVNFLGSLPHDQVPVHMKALDALVVPSRGHKGWVEQFGRVLVEAMSLDVIVIGSDSGEIPHVISDVGFVHRENDVESLREKMDEVMNISIQDRRALANRARASVLERFDYEGIAASYHALISSCLAAEAPTLREELQVSP